MLNMKLKLGEKRNSFKKIFVSWLYLINSSLYVHIYIYVLYYIILYMYEHIYNYYSIQTSTFLSNNGEKSKNALPFSLTMLIRKQGRFPPATPWR